MKEIKSTANLDAIIKDSFTEAQILFKHSTRCPTSAMALNRMKSYLDKPNFHLIDVIGQRELSNNIANTFNTTHQSPQLLIIQNGERIFDASHLGISPSVVERELKETTN